MKFMTSAMSWLLATTVLAGTIAAPAAAATPTAPAIEIDGERLETSVPPERKDGTVFVPMRDIFEALGATVHWIDETRTVFAKGESTVLQLTVDELEAHVNGIEALLPLPPYLQSGTEMVPLRFVGEALGTEVEWVAEENKVVIRDEAEAVEAETVVIEYEPGYDSSSWRSQPFREDGVVWVPAGSFVELTRNWYDSFTVDPEPDGKVTVNAGEFSYIFQAGSDRMTYNGLEVALPEPARLINDDVYLPLETMLWLRSFKIEAQEAEWIDIGGKTEEDLLRDIAAWSTTKDAGAQDGAGVRKSDELSWYEGGIKNGIPEGKGNFYLRGIPYYSGEVSGGLPNGKGVFYYVDRNTDLIHREGTFRNGLNHGRVITYEVSPSTGENEVRFDMHYVDGVREGPGKVLYEDTLLYEGEYRDGKLNGFGTEYNFAGEVVYRGDFVDGEYDGQGLYEYAFGYRYEGEFDAGVPTGDGMLYRKSENREFVKVPGDVVLLPFGEQFYVGQAKNGKPEGSGALYNSIGFLTYEGMFRDGAFHGDGAFYDVMDTYDYQIGDLRPAVLYEGTFAFGALKEGKVYKGDKIEYANGVLVYEGGLQDFEPHGEGTWYSASGAVIYEGAFNQGFIEPTEDGNVTKDLRQAAEEFENAASYSEADGVVFIEDEAYDRRFEELPHAVRSEILEAYLLPRLTDETYQQYFYITSGLGPRMEVRYMDGDFSYRYLP